MTFSQVFQPSSNAEGDSVPNLYSKDIVHKGNTLAKEDIALMMTTVFGRKQRYCFSDKQTS